MLRADLTFMKSGSLNLVEPSGSVQDCNGTALPLQRIKEDRNALQTIKGKFNWTGHILRRNSLIKHIIEEK